MQHKNLKNITYVLFALLFCSKTPSLQAAAEKVLATGAAAVSLLTYNASRNSVTDEFVSGYTISLDKIIEDLEEQGKTHNIGVLDFSSNRLSIRGATELLNWLAKAKRSENFKHVEKCDLSYNSRIYATTPTAPNKAFEAALQKVLKLGITIDIEGNFIANERWVCHFEMQWRAKELKEASSLGEQEGQIIERVKAWMENLHYDDMPADEIT